MPVEHLIDALELKPNIVESYVLVHEMKVVLNIGPHRLMPCIGIKTYRSNVVPGQPFHFAASHYVLTPDMTEPHIPSRTYEEYEIAAVERAIAITTNLLQSAIDAGHAPSEDWLVKNEDF